MPDSATLSEKSAATIRATLPAVSDAIGEISANFYDRLFAAHPELLRDLFNRGNQANGAQQRALAGAIAAFAAALVDRPTVPPDTLLGRIAHKHVSLGITRDQYPVVHTHLFAAIAEVLGDAVTVDVAAAWDEVYWLMADALVTIEARLYAEAGVRAGDVWREYRVIERRNETDDVLTFRARPADGSPAPSFLPGQYVSVQVRLPDGAHQIRQYSLSSGSRDALCFTVKKVTGEPDGEVSTHLHDHVREGALLRVGPPAGNVTLGEGDGPVLLASAGIGCTPMINMLAHLAATGSPRRTIAVHGDRSPRTHAFRDELGRLAAELPDADVHVWYERPDAPWPAGRTGLVDLTAVPVPAEATAYLCGPVPFMRAARTQLLEQGVRPDDIHYEVFGPTDHLMLDPDGERLQEGAGQSAGATADTAVV